MWRYPYPAGIILGLISTPVAVGPYLFVCAGEGKGRNFSACLRMKAADGKITYEELYRSTELQNNYYNTPAVYQDAVFGFGGAPRSGFLHCTNLADGRLLWRHDSPDWTNDRNLVIADGLIFAITKNDELVMAEASRAGYKELGRVKPGIALGRPQQPTIANGRLYLRGNEWVGLLPGRSIARRPLNGPYCASQIVGPRNSLVFGHVGIPWFCENHSRRLRRTPHSLALWVGWPCGRLGWPRRRSAQRDGVQAAGRFKDHQGLPDHSHIVDPQDLDPLTGQGQGRSYGAIAAVCFRIA